MFAVVQAYAKDRSWLDRGEQFAKRDRFPRDAVAAEQIAVDAECRAVSLECRVLDEAVGCLVADDFHT